MENVVRPVSCKNRIKHSELTGLRIIHNRYCNNGVIGHHGDCNIYRSIQVYGNAFCSCGLLHDLGGYLRTGLIEILYPRYWRDYCLQETNEDEDQYTPEQKRKKAQDQEESKKLLESIFGFQDGSEQEIIEEYEEYRVLLLEIFGESDLLMSRLNFHKDQSLELFRNEARLTSPKQ